jgi:UDP-N-acetylmuramoylalanine--D-glutamate ligase
MKDRIVVLGAAESGVGAAVLALKKGFEVFVSDMGTIKPEYKSMLEQYAIEWEEGHHTEEKILNAKEIIKSPGIPENAPMIVKARQAGIPIINEIEFAGRYTHAKMICITGSNGKTTTTSLIYHIFKDAGYNVGLAGNIGRSLALQIAEGKNYDYYIIELSSFQLDNMYKFRANIAVLLNITPDHLDRYNNSMQEYTDAKMRILQNQTEEDAFVYWADDPIIAKELKKYGIKSQLCPFSILKKNGMIGYISDGEYVIERPTPFNMEQESLSLRGKHNMYNSLAAGIAAHLSGIKDETLRQSLGDFEGVEHRLEKVARVGGVQYINDSKATNVDACWYALESMTTPTILIIGGKDKGNDYNAIKDLVKEKCAGLVFLGADNTKLHNFFDGMGIPIADTHSMKDCVAECVKMAKPGYTVLLSPCCASFDLFKNMEDRGEQFKELVRAL